MRPSLTCVTTRFCVPRAFDAHVSTTRRFSTPLLGVHPTASPCLTARRHKSYVLKYKRGHLPRDLKDLQGAVGCLYGELPDVDEYAQFVLPQDLVASYHQLGYLKLPRPVFGAAQTDILADEANELANNVEHHPKSENLYATSLANLTPGPLFYCQGQWRACWGMHDLVHHPNLTVAASQVLGNSLVRLWYDEVYSKEARVGPALPWQQHYAQWQHTAPIHHVTLFVALDHLNKDRGAPCVIPGSHRWRDGGLLPPIPYDPSKDEAQQLNTIWDVVDEEETEMLMDTPPTTIDLQRGEVLLIHPLTLFATHGNRSFGPARCAKVHYMGSRVTAACDGPLLPRTTVFRHGAKIEGPFFPVVFDPAVAEDFDPPTGLVEE